MVCFLRTAMKITIAVRHMEVSEALREYAVEKVSHLTHYFDRIIGVDIVLDAQKERQICELIAYLIRKKRIVASAEADDLYAAIDAAVDKLKKQLVRFKERLQEKRAPELALQEEEAGEVEASPPTSEPPEILRTRVYLKKPMTAEEAVLQLDAYDKKDFLIYMDAEEQELRILHRLSDGRYELIEPVY